MITHYRTFEELTDTATAYMAILRYNLKNGKKHCPKGIPKKEVGKLLPWGHRTISKTKPIFLDIHHDIKPEYLQNYLNDFCYKFNLYLFGENLFDRLLIATVSYKNQFRHTCG